jgi:hypothetical protein
VIVQPGARCWIAGQCLGKSLDQGWRSLGPETLNVQTTDRYGRSVAEVVCDININLALVDDGQAFAYRQYLGGCDDKEYLDAEFRASRSRRYSCKEIGSYDRAQVLLRQGHAYLDGNGDGQACEALR